MAAPDRPTLRRLTIAHPIRLGCLAAVVVSGLILLSMRSTGDRPPERLVRNPSETPATMTAVAPDPAWAKLSSIEQRALGPLRGIWSAMAVGQQEKWRLVVRRIQGQPAHVQHRVEMRMQQWAKMTVVQHAKARLTFLEVARGLNPIQRKERWLAYQRLQPSPRRASSSAGAPDPLPPGLVRAVPGATTVLLSQLAKPPAAVESRQPLDDAPVPALIDRSDAPWPASASAPAGHSQEMELHGPYIDRNVYR